MNLKDGVRYKKGDVVYLNKVLTPLRDQSPNFRPLKIDDKDENFNSYSEFVKFEDVGFSFYLISGRHLINGFSLGYRSGRL